LLNKARWVARLAVTKVELKIDLRQFILKGIKFGFIGGIGTVLNLGILFGLTEYAHLYYIYSELIAIVLVFGFNYMGNILVGNIRIDRRTKDEMR